MENSHGAYRVDGGVNIEEDNVKIMEENEMKDV